MRTLPLILVALHRVTITIDDVHLLIEGPNADLGEDGPVTIHLEPADREEALQLASALKHAALRCEEIAEHLPPAMIVEDVG